MFDPNAWSWPQWTMLILLAIGFAITASLHGKPKATENHNGFVALFRVALWMFILIFGGFFR